MGRPITKRHLVLTLAECRKAGIPAAVYAHSNVILWGTLVVAVKYSEFDDKQGRFGFHLTPKEKREGKVDADMVLLICGHGDNFDATFYLFDTLDPVFYHADGSLKHFWNYSVHERPDMKAHVLNSANMSRHRLRSAADWGRLKERMLLKLAA